MGYIIAYFVLFATIFFFAYRWEWKNNREGVKSAFRLILFLMGLIALNYAFALFQNLTLDPAKYSHPFNAKRQAVGLMELPKSWKPEKEVFGSWTEYLNTLGTTYRQSFIPADTISIQQIHHAKSVEVIDGEIVTETDWFKSNARSMYLIYNFKEENHSAYYTSGNKARDLSRQEAVDTLKVWGVIR
ncbi:hypothetical protein H8S95_09980 [Pontibacter sp. KCTC 32443]|uniref:hypothetical protein n=1 Tax=Pontibacter TaxID=323449 RepID=UPI00164D6739|nr:MULTISPECIES: hypothetical protein [Pontibacter]MBC5774389.1 hypothetical protein [Pontibacter sp. KCTC 32443]